MCVYSCVYMCLLVRVMGSYSSQPVKSMSNMSFQRLQNNLIFKSNRQHISKQFYLLYSNGQIRSGKDS